MGPATLIPPRQWRAAGGFTLVEVLLVLALLALGGMILIPAAGGILGGRRAASPEDTLTSVLQQARRDAVLTGREISLRFDGEAQQFVWEGANVRLGGTGPQVKLDFLRANSGSAVLIGGRLVETTTVPAVRFYPDGTCDPVRVQLRAGDGAARVIVIDPWTCAPGLEAKS